MCEQCQKYWITGYLTGVGKLEIMDRAKPQQSYFFLKLHLSLQLPHSVSCQSTVRHPEGLGEHVYTCQEREEQERFIGIISVIEMFPFMWLAGCSALFHWRGQVVNRRKGVEWFPTFHKHVEASSASWLCHCPQCRSWVAIANGIMGISADQTGLRSMRWIHFGKVEMSGGLGLQGLTYGLGSMLSSRCLMSTDYCTETLLWNFSTFSTHNSESWIIISSFLY